MNWYIWLLYFVVLTFIYLLFWWLDKCGNDEVCTTLESTIKAFEKRYEYLTLIEKFELKKLKKLMKWWR